MHCANCGAGLASGVTFCPSCGKPALGSTPASSVHSSRGMQRNVAGALCYLAGFITGIFSLVCEPYKHDRFVRFHAFQAIFLTVAWLAVYFVFGIVSSMFVLQLWQVMWMLYSLLGFAFFLLWIFLMYKAYSNEQFKLLVIGDLAAQHA